jgi:hypothetical protein
MSAKRRRAYAKAVRRLQALAAIPVVAPLVLAAANTDSGFEYMNAMGAANRLHAEIAAIVVARDALLDLPSAQVLTGSVL